MGDVVFLPFYELLLKRGVEVRFFHRVEALKAHDGLVEEIEIDVQAAVPPATTPKTYVTPESPPERRPGSPGLAGGSVDDRREAGRASRL